MLRVLLIVGLVALNLGLRDPALAQSDCLKDCGAGGATGIAHRDCSAGEDECHVTLCSGHHVWGGTSFCWDGNDSFVDNCGGDCGNAHECYPMIE